VPTGQGWPLYARERSVLTSPATYSPVLRASAAYRGIFCGIPDCPFQALITTDD
jgi:hypothetical protein